MARTKPKGSASKEKTPESGCGFSCGNFEEMFKMMQNSCSADKSSSDCCAMMQQMCCGKAKEKVK
jgi:hypothetical protein